MNRASNITALILAGGFGTRVKDLLGELPKPMAPVNGKPFIEWIVRWLKAQSIRDVIISAGYRAEVLEEYFNASPVPDINVRCITESEPMGTGGGLAFAAYACNTQPDAWLVLNGDSLIFTDINSVISALCGAEGVVVTRPVTDTSRYGRVQFDESNRIIAFKEKQPGEGQINAGVYLLKHALLSTFPESRPVSLENQVFPQLIQQINGLIAHPVDAPFLDIGTPETLPLAEAFISDNLDQFS